MITGFRRLLPCLIYLLPAALIAFGLPVYAPGVTSTEALLSGGFVLLLGAVIHLALELVEAQRLTRA